MDLGAAFLTALVVWLAALMTPGPDFAATVHASVGGSRRSGLAVGGGVTVGMAAWYGLVAMMMSSEVVGRAYRRVERGINAVTGAVFVGVGARLASDR